MEDIVNRLRGFKSAAAQSWSHEAADEIESLRSQLAEVTRERDAVKCLMDCYNLGGWTDSIGVAEQLLATQAHAARLENALEIIAGRRQCIDNLLSNVDIANAALSTPSTSTPCMSMMRNCCAGPPRSGKALKESAPTNF